MKIGIDTFGCDHARSGFGSYLLSLISNLPKKDNFSYELFGSELDRYTYTSENALPFKSIQVFDSLAAERFWHLFGIKKYFLKNNYDVVIYPAVEKVLPVSFKTKGVAVVNSIITKNIKNYSGFYKWQIKKGLNKVAMIIAASNAIKEDLRNIGIYPDKIKVIYNGINHKIFYPMIDLDEDVIQISPFAIKRPYFIYGSKLSGPEKNHAQLIKAFEIFKKKTGLPHRLVISGNEGAYADEIRNLAYESEYSSDIFIVGYFSHENFAKLYAGAQACVFPADNEGVGMPILEAMACGIPVICSKSGALPEIGGDVPLYFDSSKPDEIASCMERVIEDEKLREKMIADGLEWAGKFDWEETVKQTLGCIEEVFKY